MISVILSPLSRIRPVEERERGIGREGEKTGLLGDVFEFKPTNLTSEIFLHVNFHGIVHN